jgi:hypothetical protein
LRLKGTGPNRPLVLLVSIVVVVAVIAVAYFVFLAPR